MNSIIYSFMMYMNFVTFLDLMHVADFYHHFFHLTVFVIRAVLFETLKLL